MSQHRTANYLDLLVSPFRLAIRAEAVLGVMRDVPVTEHVLFRDCDVPQADLRARFLGETRPIAPFVIVLECDADWVGLGVDAVGNVRPGKEPVVTKVPEFGLLFPKLFEGALRVGDRLLLLLQPTAVRNVFIEGE